MTVLADNAPNAGAIIGGILGGLVLLGLYLLPAIVAMVRRVPNAGSVIVIDVLLGWTLVGWVAALAMAVRSKPPGPAPPGG